MTPGVVNRKLIVLQKSSTAIALPTAEIRGHSGRTATSRAARIFVLPSVSATVRTSKRLNGCCLVQEVFKCADPCDDGDEAVPGHYAAGDGNRVLSCLGFGRCRVPALRLQHADLSSDRGPWSRDNSLCSGQG
jgi:hypothetical protein